jgi:hypothetical protein
MSRPAWTRGLEVANAVEELRRKVFRKQLMEAADALARKLAPAEPPPPVPEQP